MLGVAGDITSQGPRDPAVYGRGSSAKSTYHDKEIGDEPGIRRCDILYINISNISITDLTRIVVGELP